MVRGEGRKEGKEAPDRVACRTQQLLLQRAANLLRYEDAITAEKSCARTPRPPSVARHSAIKARELCNPLFIGEFGVVRALKRVFEGKCRGV